ncbi:MAG: hypothetical protein ACERIG_07905, partial [Hyphomicrobium sp.]
CKNKAVLTHQVGLIAPSASARIRPSNQGRRAGDAMRIFAIAALAIPLAACAQGTVSLDDQSISPVFAEQPNPQERAKKAMYEFLIRNDVDTETATAAMMNKEIMDAVMRKIRAHGKSVPQQSTS